MPFVSDTLESMSGGSAATLCLSAWCRTELEAEFFVADWGDGAGADNGANALVEASKRASRRWDACLAVWRATVARATGLGVRVVKNRGSRRNGAALSPETGVFAPPSPFFNNVKCVRETQILLAQVPPQGVLECGRAGLVIHKLSSLKRCCFVGAMVSVLRALAAMLIMALV